MDQVSVSKYFNWTKRAKRKNIEVVDLLEKPDIPKVPANKMKKKGGGGHKVKEYSKSENSVQKRAIITGI